MRLYGPVVYGFARKRGLGDADAADLMQEVLRSVARNAETMEYDSKHGTFRGWLFTVTRDKICNFLSAQKNRPRRTGDSRFPITPVPDREAEPDSDWDIEYQRQLAAKAMDRVKHVFRSSIWQAFWKTAVDDRPAQDVGLELKMTPGAVYVAKCRVLTRLREEVQRLRAEAEAW
ncbi:transcriptional control [Fimbriiglobus ruber]|uniref:Transcriptional control n=1 Tax=Fimbriiglobus ruber TaxID=1908690 RepID=A0A225DPG1_9BACT|nr:transcriptional control [Fimbriiglobus ruber]